MDFGSLPAYLKHPHYLAPFAMTPEALGSKPHSERAAFAQFQVL